MHWTCQFSRASAVRFGWRLAIRVYSTLKKHTITPGTVYNIQVNTVCTFFCSFSSYSSHRIPSCRSLSVPILDNLGKRFKKSWKTGNRRNSHLTWGPCSSCCAPCCCMSCRPCCSRCPCTRGCCCTPPAAPRWRSARCCCHTAPGTDHKPPDTCTRVTCHV